MSTSIQLDDYDRAIIDLLRHDGRASYRQLAGALGISEGTIRNRIARLHEHGVMRVVASIDPRKLGAPLDCIIGLEVDARQVEAIALRLSGCRELRYIGIATGPYDLVIAGDFESEAHLLEFLTHTLASIDGFKRSVTTHILRTVKPSFDTEPSLISARS